MSSQLEALINDVTRKAYENVAHWMSSDPVIGSQLRDGLRSALDAFDSIDDRQANRSALLLHMRKRVDDVLAYYGELPGSQGEWECSALRQVHAEIERLLAAEDAPST